MKEFKGHLNRGTDLRIAIVISRFNELIGKNLLHGAIDTLKRYGVKEEYIITTWVPGAFEIPIIAKKLASTGEYQAIITLGAVIRGATPHFDYVAGPMSSGIANISLETGVPIIFGVLTTNTLEQATERAGSKCGNKGSECAVAALEMADLIQQIEEKSPSRSKFLRDPSHEMARQRLEDALK